MEEVVQINLSFSTVSSAEDMSILSSELLQLWLLPKSTASKRFLTTSSYLRPWRQKIYIYVAQDSKLTLLQGMANHKRNNTVVKPDEELAGEYLYCAAWYRIDMPNQSYFSVQSFWILIPQMSVTIIFLTWSAQWQKLWSVCECAAF